MDIEEILNRHRIVEIHKNRHNNIIIPTDETIIPITDDLDFVYLLFEYHEDPSPVGDLLFNITNTIDVYCSNNGKCYYDDYHKHIIVSKINHLNTPQLFIANLIHESTHWLLHLHDNNNKLNYNEEEIVVEIVTIRILEKLNVSKDNDVIEYCLEYIDQYLEELRKTETNINESIKKIKINVEELTQLFCGTFLQGQST